ncbi:MAG: hypothetical protein ACREYE_24525 [Gammaproteobacteria bacterium]
MDTADSTQPIPQDLSAFARKLWKAGRRVAELEYEVRLLKEQRRELAHLVQSLMAREEALDDR